MSRGMVAKPTTLTLDQFKAMPRQEVIITMECSGNDGLPFLQSAIGNARWAGASLAEMLNAAQIKDGALEVVFYGTDQGDEVVQKDTPLEFKFNGTFARSMPLDDAMNPANLLCYEMNGAPLPAANGFPVPADRPRLVRRCQREMAPRHRSARHALSGTLHGPRLRDGARGGA